MERHKFNTGETVPETGIYRVTHSGHRLPHEVTLLANQVFPRCSKCQNAVQFEAVRHASLIEADKSFKVVIYELPTLEDDDNGNSEAMAG